MAELRPGLRLSDCGLRGQITQRAGDLAAPALVGAVEAVAGVAVPGVLEAAFAGDARGAVWMAPAELLLFVPRGEVTGAVEMLEAALADSHRMVLDVSHARAVLRLEGADAAETLAKGAPLDFTDAGFPVGRARRTHLGGLAAGIWRRGPEQWELVCFRSFAHHLYAWLETSGVEGAEVGRFGI